MPTEDASSELLRAHRPLLAYDPQGDYRALAVDSVVENGNSLKRGGRLLADGRGTTGHDLTLQFLASYDAQKEDRLVEAPFRAATARRLQALQRNIDVVYVRPPKRDGDCLWLQYWIWFYYHPGNLLGAGRHEGDWKLVQIGLDPLTHKPVSVVSTHATESRAYAWEKVASQECDGCAGECRHPRVEVGLFSHSMRLSSSAGPSQADREPGLEVLPTLRRLGPWHEWPGRWGGSDGFGGFGSSPRGPCASHPAWEQPASFAAKAKRRAPADALIRAIGKLLPEPPRPRLRLVNRVGDDVVVELSLPRSQLRRHRWVFLTVHGLSGKRIVRKRPVSIGREPVRVSVPLRDGHPKQTLVGASTFTWLRRRSEVVWAKAIPLDSPQAPRPWSERVKKRFHYELVCHLSAFGAASAKEIERRRFNVLDLALTREEIEEVVDSARRHGLVEPLGHSRRGDGTPTDADEWIPTERGRLRSRRLGEAAPALFKAAPPALIAAVIGLLGKTFDVGGNLFFVIAIAIAALLLAPAVFAFVLHLSHGALPRTVASVWDRHAVELPELNRWYSRRYRLIPYVLTGLAVAVVMAWLIVGTGNGYSISGQLASMFLGGILGGVCAALITDLQRTAALRKEAIAARDWQG